MQAFVVDVPGDVARLCDDIDRLLRIAERLVREALAVHVHLESAFHDQRPEDRNAAARREPAMALVGMDVAHGRAERKPPADRIALVAGMPEERRADDLRDVLRDHLGVAGESAAGQHQRVAAEILEAAVGALQAHAAHAPVRIGEQLVTSASVSTSMPLALDRRRQRAHQFRARAIRRAMHALHAVAGIEEAVHQRQRHTMTIDQPFDRAADSRASASAMPSHRSDAWPSSTMSAANTLAASRSMPLRAARAYRRRDQARRHRRGAERRGCRARAP
jgi:hypothetical protein